MKPRHAIALGVVGTILGITGYIGATQPRHIALPQLYPDYRLTPGLIATQDIKLLTATNPTYSQAHRNTTEKMKSFVRAEYSNVKCPLPSDCEVDHLIPLALGGADNTANLWLQPAINEWDGVNYGYHEKDAIESFLVLQMKAKNMTPAKAQDCILRDWVSCYRQYFKPTFGAVDSTVADPDDEM